MVGVPRSTGCRTCVKRRVKCDQARPICSNCKKGNRACLGYSQRIKFQDEGPRLRDKFGNSSSADTEVSLGPASSRHDLTTVSTPSSAVIDDDILWQPSSVGGYGDITSWQALELEETGAKVPALFAIVEGKTTEYSNLNVQPELHGFFIRDPTQLFDKNKIDKLDVSFIGASMYSPMIVQDQMLQEFMSAVAPNTPDSIPTIMKSTSQWMNNLPGLSGIDALLDHAIRAVTLIHIGRFHHCDIFVDEAGSYYGKSLRLLNKAIADPVSRMSNITLCATILLSFYEMFASDNDASWVRHAGGASALMRIRGPDRHRTGIDKDIFLAYRHTLVVEALRSNVTSFLDEPEWRQLAMDLHQEARQKSPMLSSKQDLFDTAEMLHTCLVKTTRHNARVDRLFQQPTHFPNQEWEVTYHELAICRSSFIENFNTFRAAVAKIGQTPKTVRTNDPIMPINYVYGNVFLSLLHVGFYQALTICNLNMIGLGTQLVSRDLITSQELDIYKDGNQSTALKICRSVNFMLRSSFLGPFYAVFALRLAGHVFDEGTLKRDWTTAKLHEIGDRSIKFAKVIPWLEDMRRSKDTVFEAIARVKSRQECIEYE